MKFVEKKILRIMPTGACTINLTNSIIKNNRLHLFYETSYTNIHIYSKNQNLQTPLKAGENIQYRKKYLT